MQEEIELIEEVTWAREKIHVLNRLDKDMREELGNYGFEKLIIQNALYLSLFLFSIFITFVGVYFWLNDHKPIYLLTIIFPIISIGFIYSIIREEKKKNLFRFIGKFPIPLEDLLDIAEEFVFEERDSLEEVVAWRINNTSTKDNDKYGHLFDESCWEDPEKAKEQCLVLAILMVSLQKFIYKNKKLYDEHVKMVTSINPGYVVKSKKAAPEPINPADIQTFGGFTAEDLFTGNGKK